MKRSRRLVFVSGYRLTGHGGGIASGRSYYFALRELFPGPIALVSSEEDRSVIMDPSRETFVGIPKSGSLKKIVTVLSRRSLDRMSPEADRWLLNNLQQEDLLFVNGAVIGRLCALVGKKNRCQNTILVHQNVERDYFSTNGGGIIKQMLLNGISEKNQREGYRAAWCNLFLTEPDRERCRFLYGPSLGFSLVCPTFLPEDLSELPLIKQELNFQKNLNILVSGTLYAPQFEEPFMEFLQQEWQTFRKLFPDSRLTVAGFSPSSRLKRASEQYGFTLVPDPKEMDDLYREANIYLSLTYGGSGKKYRLMEPLRWGLPIVSHVHSLAGYEEIKGSRWVFPFSNSESLLKAFSEIEGRSSMSLAERQEVQSSFFDHYSFRRGKEKMRSLLAPLMEEKKT